MNTTGLQALAVAALTLLVLCAGPLDAAASCPEEAYDCPCHLRSLMRPAAEDRLCSTAADCVTVTDVECQLSVVLSRAGAGKKMWKGWIQDSTPEAPSGVECFEAACVWAREAEAQRQLKSSPPRAQ